MTRSVPGHQPGAAAPRRARRPLRVHVVDEGALVTAGVRALLAATPHEVASRPLDPLAPPTGAVDVLLFDPLRDGGAIEDQLGRVSGLGGRILAFSWTATALDVSRALSAGAHGYALKSSSSEQLVAAIEAVHHGVRVVPVRRPAPARGAGDRLTPREGEIAQLISQGLSNAEIADLLFVSVNSVKTHLRHIYRKTGLERRAQLVRWALRHPAG